MLQENLRVVVGGKQLKRYRHSPTPRFAGTSPIEPAICTREILPDPDPIVTPLSRPHTALQDPLKNHRGRLEYRRIDDGEEV
jgi:hypothetical protein